MTVPTAPTFVPVIRWLYRLCFPFVFLLLLPAYLRRMQRRGNYRANFWQRLGYYPAELRARLATEPPRPWLQAVSVGEMLTALKLVAAIRAQAPDLPLILSTTTTTGFALARQRAPAGVEILYTPIDSTGAARRALQVLRPSQIIIVDGGLWPNLLWIARDLATPTALVNARLSPRSAKRFSRFPRIAATLFGSLDFVGIAEANEAARWETLGVAPASIEYTGSIKFDDQQYETDAGATPKAHELAEPRDVLAALGLAPGTPILLGGSTHSGEEHLLASMFLELRRSFTNLFLILVPRHAERTPEIQTELEGLGLTVATRLGLAATDSAATCDCLLVNTTGELRDWYTLATIVVIGKSFTAIGGQNPAEAIAAGKPVLFGPHMENFADLTAALLAAKGASQVGDAAHLTQECFDMLADPPRAARMAKAGRAVLSAHHGAASRTATHLLRMEKKALASGEDHPDISRPAQLERAL